MEGREFIVFDYIKKEWHKGESLEEVIDHFDILEKVHEGLSVNTGQVKVPTNSATTFINQAHSQGRKLQAVVSGGNYHARVLKKVKGISFWQGVDKGLKVYYQKEEVQFPDLPTPRYLHQMVCMTIGGQLHLLVIGGKERIYDTTSLNSVYKLNIQECLKAKTGKSQVILNEWVECAPMNEGRCMFAATVVSNRYVYVYGGTKEAIQHQNTLVNTVCERYDAQTNTWASFSIENGPSLSSFGWCNGTDEGVIYVLGGSDGYCL